MTDPVWLACVVAYGFGAAQSLRLRPAIGLPVVVVAAAAYLVTVNVADIGVPRQDLSTAWIAGLALGAWLALRARHRARQSSEREAAQENL